MGEVYKARDGRLDRTVAVKILPAEMAADPERRRRFEQEARSVAALNHPNVVAVYDAGVQDDVAFLVEGWSRDGGTLFVIGKGTVIRDYPPDSRDYAEFCQSSSRLDPSRDGKYLRGARYSVRASIWLEGVEPPRSFWSRLLR